MMRRSLGKLAEYFAPHNSVMGEGEASKLKNDRFGRFDLDAAAEQINVDKDFLKFCYKRKYSNFGKVVQLYPSEYLKGSKPVASYDKYAIPERVPDGRAKRYRMRHITSDFFKR